MWVFCCGMQRSGSTLQFQIAAHLVEQAGLGTRVEWVPPQEFGKVRDKYAGYGGWKVFKSHICTEQMVEEFQRNNALGVYIYRDIRDVFVSLIRKNKLTYSPTWVDNLLEVFLNDYRRWTTQPRMLVSRYEDVLTDLAAEVERIAGHLGIPLERAESESVARLYTREKQLERISEAAANNDLTTARGNVLNPRTLLHTNHIQSGEWGTWRGYLTPRQIAFIEDGARQWLLDHDYPLDLGERRRSWLAFWGRQEMRARRMARGGLNRLGLLGRPDGSRK